MNKPIAGVAAANATTGRRSLNLIFAGLFVVAALGEAALWAAGFYSVSLDDSTRVLLSDHLTLETMVLPFIWPPLYKIIIGLALYVHHDLFVTPRVVAMIAGLGQLGALVYLSNALFRDKVTNLITAALGAFFYQRLFMSVSPMSETFYNGLLPLAFAQFAVWLRDERVRDITLASTYLALASALRYEAWFIMLAYGPYLLYLCFIARRLSIRELVINASIIGAFPVFWLIDATLTYGSPAALLVTRWQATANGATLVKFILASHVYNLAHDIMISPLLFGVYALFQRARRDMVFRQWTIAVGVSLLAITAVTLATMSIDTGFTWRLAGAFSVMLIPFCARFIVDQVAKVRGEWRTVALVAMTSAFMFLFAVKSVRLLNTYLETPMFHRDDLDAGRRLGALLAASDKNALVEERDDYHFLNVFVASNVPERLVGTAGDDPNQVALYVGAPDHFRVHDPEMYALYVAQKFDLDHGGDAALLAKNRIGYLVVRAPEAIAGLNSNPRMHKLETFGMWTLYAYDGA